MAANVVAMLASHSAWTLATGATCAAAAPRPGKKPFSSVFLLDRLRITGSR
jgi:hypothetical protein